MIHVIVGSSFELRVQRAFVGVAFGTLHLFWSALDGCACERVQPGVRL